MGVAISNSEATAVLNARFAGAPYAPPPAHAVSLHTADPGPTDAPAFEVTGGGYAPQPCEFVPSTAGGPVSNSGAVTFPNMPGVTVSWFLVDARGVGVAGALGPRIRPQTRAALASPVALTAGQSLTIAAGALTVGMA